MYKLFQLLPDFKGKLRLSKMVFSGRIKAGTEQQFTVNDGLKFTTPNLTENVSFELFVNGSYEPETMQIILNNLPKNGVFVDVGANIGAISVPLAKTRPDVSVVAFEASPAVYSYLKRNVENNKLSNIQANNLAIHTLDDGELPFFSTMEKNGKGSFSPVFTEESVMVKTISLRTFLGAKNLVPDLIKVDVEGYEKLIFESAGEVLDTPGLKILFEFVDWAEELANYKPGESQQLLLDKGFTLTDINTGAEVRQALTKGSAMLLATKKNA
ncbi:MAG: FkbM family methyltransferase [Bacteroidota bacterium]